jgi:hypothetical protein
MFEFHPDISVGKRLQSDKNEANDIDPSLGTLTITPGDTQ